jgi:superfamily II DNA or RNA helicase
MTIEIKDFLPLYPSVSGSDKENFYESIYQKKEFYDEKVPITEFIMEDKWSLLKQQKIIARFLSSHTPYDRLLLDHEMGSGKSCAAIGAIEQIKKEGHGFKDVIIVAPGPKLIQNFIHEIVMKCTPKEQYNIPNMDRMGEEKRNMKMKAIVRKKGGYNFFTYGELAKEIQSLKHPNATGKDVYKNVADVFSNKIIVMDEIHHLRPKEGKMEESAMYNEIKNMCRYAKNTKILLMSGTPMSCYLWLLNCVI